MDYGTQSSARRTIRVITASASAADCPGDANREAIAVGAELSPLHLEGIGEESSTAPVITADCLHCLSARLVLLGNPKEREGDSGVNVKTIPG